MSENTHENMTRSLFTLSTTIDYHNLEDLKNIITAHKSDIEKWVIAYHDKDIYTEEETTSNPAAKLGALKKAHYHVYVSMNRTRSFKAIAGWFGVPCNLIQAVGDKIKDKTIPNNVRFAVAVTYARHLNAPEKYQYPIEAVVSNYDFTKDEAIGMEYQNHKAAITTAEGRRDIRKEQIVEGIVSGEIRQFNYFDHISSVEFVRYKSAIESAFKYRTDKLRAQVDRNMECIFIYGPAGVGKTTWAKDYCKTHGLSIYISGSGSDFAGEYAGQDCVVLDDLRPSTMGLADLLKLLDNNTSSSVKSRYYNKTLECSLIIISSSQPIDDFFHNVFSEQPESIIQLKRRCGTYMEFTKEYIMVSFYDRKIRDYTSPVVLKNPIANRFAESEKLSEEEQKAKITDLFQDAAIVESVNGFLPVSDDESPVF